MPKVRSERKKVAPRHNPLHVDLLRHSGTHIPELENKQCRKKCIVDDLEGGVDQDGSSVVPKQLSSKIIRMARNQLNSKSPLVSRAGEDESDLEDDSLSENEDGEGINVDADGFVVVDELEDEEDQAFESRMLQERKVAAAAAPTLADFILAKLNCSESSSHPPATASSPEEDENDPSALPPKVVEVFTAMRLFLQRYRSGKMPKAFKVLPRMQRWEEVLLLTEPHNWSKQAMFQATRIFISNLSAVGAQRFLCLVLLPAVREDIAANKKLNYHLYYALKKALFKPAAFFKGIFLPMALEGCTVREAAIVGSVVARVSIPQIQVAAALMRLAMVPPHTFNPVISLLMTALINKKCSLPAKAIAACVAHFSAFAERTELLPVSWHKAFLVFVQRYKFSISEQERTMLKSVLRVHFHEKIGPEIRRELLVRDPAQLLQQQQAELMKKAGLAAGTAEKNMDEVDCVMS